MMYHVIAIHNVGAINVGVDYGSRSNRLDRGAHKHGEKRHFGAKFLFIIFSILLPQLHQLTHVDFLKCSQQGVRALNVLEPLIGPLPHG